MEKSLLGNKVNQIKAALQEQKAAEPKTLLPFVPVCTIDLMVRTGYNTSGINLADRSCKIFLGFSVTRIRRSCLNK